MTETQNASGWHRIDEATPKNIHLAMGWWDVRRGHEPEWRWVKGFWVGALEVECDSFEGDDVDWTEDGSAFLKPGWCTSVNDWDDDAYYLRRIHPTHYRDISAVPPLAGADASEANSMAANTHGADAGEAGGHPKRQSNDEAA